MIRRRGVQIALAVTIVAVLSLSGLLTQQVWSESQARGQVASARQVLTSQLARARADGLYPSELAPFQAAARRIDGESAPASSPFWRSSVTQFYQGQAAAYSHVRRDLQARERTITRAVRAQSRATIARLDKSISEAASLGLNPTAARTGRQQAEERLSRADSSSPTPGRYRSILASIGAVSRALSAQVSSRRAYLASILSAGNNSVAGVQAVGDREAASASQDLDLLGLLSPRATQYRAQIARLTASLHAQTQPLAAAVQEAALHDQVTAIHQDFGKTVPTKMIVVSTETQYLHAYENGQNVLTTPVTTGGPELPTDHGVFHIYMKASPFTFHSPWPVGSPYYYPPTPIQYWMPFYEAEGLHDASWRSNFGPGSNLQPTDLGTGNTILGTHGCVNLPYDAATFIWNWAPVGTTVVVI